MFDHYDGHIENVHVPAIFLQAAEAFTGETMYGAPVDLSFRNISKLTGDSF